MAWTQIWDGLLLRKQQSPSIAITGDSDRYILVNQFLGGGVYQHWGTFNSFIDWAIPNEGWAKHEQKLLYTKTEYMRFTIPPGTTGHVILYINKNSPLEQTYVRILREV